MRFSRRIRKKNFYKHKSRTIPKIKKALIFFAFAYFIFSGIKLIGGAFPGDNAEALYKLAEVYEEDAFESESGFDEPFFTEQEARPGGREEKIEINDVSYAGHIVGLEDAVFQPETDYSAAETPHFDEILTGDIEELSDISYLRQKFYIVDPNTDIIPEMFDVNAFMQADLSIEKSGEPKVLVFHSHSREMFSDSADSSDGIIAVGDKLAELLSDKYGIKTLHNTDSFDVVDSKPQVLGAYERMEPVITGILRDNPSVEMVIDLHRDGFPPGSPKQVVNINGKPTASIMFFNGLSLLAENGSAQKIAHLPNAYLDTNLALSFNMQLAANSLYPGLARKVYLNAYRYSLHMMPKSLLVEIGSQYNTRDEAVNAAEPLAEIIAKVVSK